MRNEWVSVTTHQPLSSRSVQVCRLNLDHNCLTNRGSVAVLNFDERARADRLKVPHVREEFIHSRSFLRYLLGSHLHLRPEQVVLQASEHGKLFAISNGSHKISFNVAHSKGTVLVALRAGGEVGVDVERHDRTVNLSGVAQSVFHRNETRKVMEHEDEVERMRAFYRCWTQKEALAKADGRGMSLLFSAFEVPINCNGHDMVELEGQDGSRRLYSLIDLPMGSDLAGALAWDGPTLDVTLLDFSAIGVDWR